MLAGGALSMDLIKRYHAIISKGDLEPDKSQEQAINRLNIVKGEIIDLRNFRATKRLSLIHI